VLLVQPVNLQEPVLDASIVDDRVDGQQLETEYHSLDLVDDVPETEKSEEEGDNDEDDHQLHDETDCLANLEFYEIFQEFMDLVLYVNHRRYVNVLKCVLKLNILWVRQEGLRVVPWVLHLRPYFF
jgi:hypothetical protein